ncbi:MAG: hypothetical protein Q8P31_00775 [Bacillota bacterium]|nr:hypothetical protein [Bacillota bacterium]
MSFRQDQWLEAMDVFEDHIADDSDPREAQRELDELAKIDADDKPHREKCASVWRIIKQGV